MIDRRRLMIGLAASAIVAGWDPLRLKWVRFVEAQACPSFDHVGPLDGVLAVDNATVNADSRDLGNIVERRPCAVLRPGSVADIRKLILFCRANNINVAARGQGHTVHGQGLVSGLIIETKWLNTIHSIGPNGADVDAGVLWRDLVVEAFNGHRLRAYGLTGYLGLSIGGVLSVGGVSINPVEGGVVDRVRELEVVTGAGDIVQCSPQQNSLLFDAVLGGLGQCGIITRVRLELTPARELARTYLLSYTDPKAFFHDFRSLAARGEADALFNLWQPFGSGLIYQINIHKYFDPLSPPNDAYLLRDLSVPPLLAVKADLPYLTTVLLVDVQVDTYKAVGWERLVKPWFDVWLPDETVEPYVTETIRSLTPQDYSPTGFVLLIPHRRAAFSRPFFRVPESPNGWVWLFDILNDSRLALSNAAFTSTMLARNRRLFDRSRQFGGVRYPIGAIDFRQTDWVAHYGNVWNDFVQRKQLYDPANILTPGPGIFS